MGVLNGHRLVDGAELVSRLLSECDPASAIRTLPPPLACELLKVVVHELKTTSPSDNKENKGAAAARPRVGERGGNRGHSLLAAAETPVYAARLLQWIEQAVQLRRRGGADYFAGPAEGQLAHALRKLSESHDPDIGVNAARLFALLGVRASPVKAQAGNLVRLARELGSSPAAKVTPGRRTTPLRGDSQAFATVEPGDWSSVRRPKKLSPAVFNAWLD